MYDKYIMEKHPDDHSSYKPGFIGSAILFTVLVAVNGFSILVFPTVLTVLIVVMTYSYKLNGSYVANIDDEHDLIWKMTSENTTG